MTDDNPFRPPAEGPSGPDQWRVPGQVEPPSEGVSGLGVAIGIAVYAAVVVVGISTQEQAMFSVGVLGGIGAFIALFVGNRMMRGLAVGYIVAFAASLILAAGTCFYLVSQL